MIRGGDISVIIQKAESRVIFVNNIQVFLLPGLIFESLGFVNQTTGPHL